MVTIIIIINYYYYFYYYYLNVHSNASEDKNIVEHAHAYVEPVVAQV